MNFKVNLIPISLLFVCSSFSLNKQKSLKLEKEV